MNRIQELVLELYDRRKYFHDRRRLAIAIASEKGDTLNFSTEIGDSIYHIVFEREWVGTFDPVTGSLLSKACSGVSDISITREVVMTPKKLADNVSVRIDIVMQNIASLKEAVSVVGFSKIADTLGDQYGVLDTARLELKGLQKQLED